MDSCFTEISKVYRFKSEYGIDEMAAILAGYDPSIMEIMVFENAANVHVAKNIGVAKGRIKEEARKAYLRKNNTYPWDRGIYENYLKISPMRYKKEERYDPVTRQTIETDFNYEDCTAAREDFFSWLINVIGIKNLPDATVAFLNLTPEVQAEQTAAETEQTNTPNGSPEGEAPAPETEVESQENGIPEKESDILKKGKRTARVPDLTINLGNKTQLQPVLSEVLDLLSPKHKEILTMKYEYGAKSKDVAAFLGISGSMVSQAKREFNEKLKGLHPAQQKLIAKALTM